MVKLILEQEFNFTAHKIPECDKKTPDFYVTNGKESYLIEVKEKGENPAHIEQREIAFSNGELFNISQSLEPRNVLKNIIHSGKKQIENFVEDINTFRIVWIHCSGVSHEVTKEQIISGIYGSVTLADWSDEKAFSGICYYFSESQFFKYKDSIDGVVITNKNNEGEFFINNYSPRYSSILASSLAKSFKQGLHDPLQRVEDGKAFIVDSPIDRKDQNKVLQHLKEKHKTEKLMVMPMQYFAAHIAVPH